jgi:tRNA dimethylallyltransferase
MWEYLDGRLDYEEMIFRGVVATRQLAKRQLTWLKSWSDMHTLGIGNAKKLATYIKLAKLELALVHFFLQISKK